MAHLQRLKTRSYLRLASSQGKQSSHVSHILKGLEQRDEMQEIVVGRIADPTFDWYGVVCGNLSDASYNPTDVIMHTFMENIAHRTIVQDSHPAQIRLNTTKIFDVCSVPKGAMLSIVSTLEEFPFLLQPIDDRVGVLLHAGGEDNELVPLADFAEELVTVGAFVDVVENRVLRANYGGVG
jgi:hypothetical protein